MERKNEKYQRRPMPYGFVAWCGLWICTIITLCSLMTEAHNNFDLPDYMFEDNFKKEVVAQKAPVKRKKARKVIVDEVIDTVSIAEVISEITDSTAVLAETLEETADTLKTDTVKKSEPVVPNNNITYNRDLAIVISTSQKETVEICGAMKPDGTICVRQTDGGLCEEHKY